ncbi:Double-strand break repair protein MRE11A [Strongyloides ratti]|uniref:Double-strand break repair protein MRE11A n=1 Tax=Strongyloides ratti TaxID=34506 RepID=A0A090L9A7_STRRB|nr:Double-strand break repair protein MRE11A [Strongyloides ratti]CEF66332.1 Double-strand break repair protein MRE11A [Strongyloides ratti]
MRREDTITITLASDVHIGYGERKFPRKNDSLTTFEEVLNNAKETDSDCILLGGDLFHENNPTREMQVAVARLLRKYCINSDKVCPLEFLSNAGEIFDHSEFPVVNYKDPNLSVSMPIFTIHGNHDDPSGTGLTALDLFHEAGLLNLFGKFKDIDNIVVNPILLKKGNTRVAIYGISSQRDDRLHRAFEEKKVIFKRPRDGNSWFNILVLHQNRPRRDFTRRTGAYIPDKFIPNFINLVIWGHEHASKPDPELVERITDGINFRFYILQPGSTVATSLCDDESGEKYCFLLAINGTEFDTTPIRLETVRQMIIDNMDLKVFPNRAKFSKTSVRPKDAPDEELIHKKISQMLEILSNSRLERQPKLPLVRLKITYQDSFTCFPPINPKRFGSLFKDVVANPEDMFVVKVNKPKNETINKQKIEEMKASDTFYDVSQVVENYFMNAKDDEALEIVTEESIFKALLEYVTTEGTIESVNKAFTKSIENQIDLLCKAIDENNSTLPCYQHLVDMEKKFEEDIAIFKKIKRQSAVSKTNENTSFNLI